MNFFPYYLNQNLKGSIVHSKNILKFRINNVKARSNDISKYQSIQKDFDELDFVLHQMYPSTYRPDTKSCSSKEIENRINYISSLIHDPSQNSFIDNKGRIVNTKLYKVKNQSILTRKESENIILPMEEFFHNRKSSRCIGKESQLLYIAELMKEYKKKIRFDSINQILRFKI